MQREQSCDVQQKALFFLLAHFLLFDAAEKWYCRRYINAFIQSQVRTLPKDTKLELEPQWWLLWCLKRWPIVRRGQQCCQASFPDASLWCFYTLVGKERKGILNQQHCKLHAPETKSWAQWVRLMSKDVLDKRGPDAREIFSSVSGYFPLPVFIQWCTAESAQALLFHYNHLYIFFFCKDPKVLIYVFACGC